MKTKTAWYRITATYAESGRTVEWKTKTAEKAREIQATAIKAGGAMYSNVTITPPEQK